MRSFIAEIYFDAAIRELERLIAELSSLHQNEAVKELRIKRDEIIDLKAKLERDGL